MSRIGSSLILTGASEKRYSFNIYLQEVKFKPIGEVYCVTTITTDINGNNIHTIKYIGITSDLSTRFNNHHKANDFKKHKTTHLCVLSCDNEDIRREIEKDLCKAYKPVSNDLLVN